MVEERPALAPFEGRELLVGIRPEAFGDAELEASDEGRDRFEALVTLAQSMGSEVIAHFDPVGGSVATEANPALESEDADAAGRDNLPQIGRLVGRLSPRTSARAGERLTVSVELDRLHFFDPGTEEAIR